MKRKLLGIPLIVWILQFIYVAVALAILIVLLATLNHQTHRLLIQALYVAAMLVIDIAWRIAIKKKKPEWF